MAVVRITFFPDPEDLVDDVDPPTPTVVETVWVKIPCELDEWRGELLDESESRQYTTPV